LRKARKFFLCRSAVRDKLQTLAKVGLGYIHVGQQANTLSGGEASASSRKELSRKRQPDGRSIFLTADNWLAFPRCSSFLKFCMSLLIRVTRLSSSRHNLEVIKTADWVIDWDLKAAMAAARIVAVGRPRISWRSRVPIRASFLKELLQRRPGNRAQAAAEITDKPAGDGGFCLCTGLNG